MKSFFIHLSMTLKYTLNPKYWFMTESFRLREEHRPQDISKSDILLMIQELKELGHIDRTKADHLESYLYDMSELDLKKVYVRSLASEKVKDDFKTCPENDAFSKTNEAEQIHKAIDEFLGCFNDKLIQ